MLSKGTVKNSKQYIADLEKEKKRIIAKAEWMRRSGSTALSSNTKLRIGLPKRQNGDAKQAPPCTWNHTGFRKCKGAF